MLQLISMHVELPLTRHILALIHFGMDLTGALYNAQRFIANIQPVPVFSTIQH